MDACVEGVGVHRDSGLVSHQFPSSMHRERHLPVGCARRIGLPCEQTHSRMCTVRAAHCTEALGQRSCMGRAQNVCGVDCRSGNDFRVACRLAGAVTYRDWGMASCPDVFCSGLDAEPESPCKALVCKVHTCVHLRMHPCVHTCVQVTCVFLVHHLPTTCRCGRYTTCTPPPRHAKSVSRFAATPRGYRAHASACLAAVVAVAVVVRTRTRTRTRTGASAWRCFTLRRVMYACVRA